QLRAEGIGVKVVFLTMYTDAHLASEALRAGASGYVLKHSAGEELVRALHEVHRGRIYLTPLIAEDVVLALANPGKGTASQLTQRQRQVLRLVAEGQTMKKVAAELGLSRRTVETYKYQIMQTLGLNTTAELIRFALDHDLTC